jgi:hypothetical protein
MTTSRSPTRRIGQIRRQAGVQQRGQLLAVTVAGEVQGVPQEL